MDCWICGKEAKTGEHLVKASDLKYYFGNVSTESPVFFNKNGRSWTMQSNNSKYVKSEAKICNECNSDRTQPYDKDWETLSLYIHNNMNQLQSNKKIKLNNVFPGRKKEALLNVHLYFCKLYGCRLASEGTPLDIWPLRNAILNNQSCKNIFIEVGTWDPKNKNAGISSIQAIEKNDSPAFVWWFYVVGKLAVCIAYNNELNNTKLVKKYWHPSTVGNYIGFEKQNT